MDEERWVCARCGCTVTARRANWKYFSKPSQETANKDSMNMPCGCRTRIWLAVDAEVA